MAIKEKIKTVAIIIGIGVVLYFGFMAYSRLEDRYCWQCTPQEMFDKGTALILDDDVKKKEKGLRYLHGAAKKMHVDAQIFLAELYLGTFPETYYVLNADKITALRNTVPANTKKGVSYFRDLADNMDVVKGNNSQIQYNLGLLFKTGILKSKRPQEEAEKWFALSANQGNPNAMYEFGMRHHAKGEYTTAGEWFTKAFNSGKDPRSAIMIGDYYLYAKGRAKDYAQCMQWYRNALDALAQTSLTFSEATKEKLTENATQRLDLVQRKTKSSGQIEIVTLNYGLGGGATNYSIFIPNITGQQIGEVKQEKDKILASIKNGKGTNSTKIVASMNEGLYWVLKTYAVGKYGPDKEFNFVITK
ncbi:MAG: sel1 repeat family protein [Desulfobacterales bacterium]|nr:sel1 repeat family protein [Desulfobacterales bacterium]